MYGSNYLSLKNVQFIIALSCCILVNYQTWQFSSFHSMQVQDFLCIYCQLGQINCPTFWWHYTDIIRTKDNLIGRILMIWGQRKQKGCAFKSMTYYVSFEEWLKNINPFQYKLKSDLWLFICIYEGLMAI